MKNTLPYDEDLPTEGGVKSSLEALETFVNYRRTQEGAGPSVETAIWLATRAICAALNQLRHDIA